ncbi:MAG: hypothetical protein SWC96_15010 [Thermodesulfobacteriota bacterium]|nr:hypothetical protein [Thermodesulfobacteriota bacterium]MDY6833126.1 hypothetical protein [Thermodesulfobacteriota bacterium]
MEKIAQYLRGWMNFFGMSEYYRPMPVSVRNLWVNIHYSRHGGTR